MEGVDWSARHATPVHAICFHWILYFFKKQKKINYDVKINRCSFGDARPLKPIPPVPTLHFFQHASALYGDLWQRKVWRQHYCDNITIGTNKALPDLRCVSEQIAVCLICYAGFIMLSLNLVLIKRWGDIFDLIVPLANLVCPCLSIKASLTFPKLNWITHNFIIIYNRVFVYREESETKWPSVILVGIFRRLLVSCGALFNL